jgi:vacuolar protein sorting-associated protein 26
MSFFGLQFGQNADIDIILENQDERKMGEIKDENGRKERMYLFYDGESVSGKVNVTLHRKTNRFEHQGIRIEFIGQIELYYDRGNHHEFLSLAKELARPGELTQNTSFDFEFNQVEKPYECYTGANVRLRYFIRVTIVRRLSDMTKEMDLLVHTLATYPEMNNPIKMEVGIEECLHIEFEYNKSKYHLKDVIVGKIYFLLVRIKIRHMEVAIIKRETTGAGPNTFHDNETIAKYEIMDGAPVKGESIPIRVFLAGYDLTPTMRDINKKFSVRYYLNLVLVDEEDRRYFKQQEITLWRKGDPRNRKAPSGLPVSGYQIPHAMARHNPGEYPSANVRTAPTPSEPNTPIAEPGFTVPNTFAQQTQYPPPLPEEEDEEPPVPEAKSTQPPQIKEVLKEQLPEEVPSRETKKIEPAASFPETTTSSVVPEIKTATSVAESNQATPNSEPVGVATPNTEPVGVATPPQLSRQIEEEKSNHKTENSNGEEENIKKTETIAEQNKNDSTKEIEEKMSNLNTKNQATVATPSPNTERETTVGGVATDIDIEDRPQPPEFDTVPDMVDDLESDEDLENAATAIVDNDDEDDDENDDL